MGHGVFRILMGKVPRSSVSGDRVNAGIFIEDTDEFSKVPSDCGCVRGCSVVRERGVGAVVLGGRWVLSELRGKTKLGFRIYRV